MLFGEMSPIDWMRELRGKLEGPGATEFQELIDRIIKVWAAPCPLQELMLKLQEAAEGNDIAFNHATEHLREEILSAFKTKETAHDLVQSKCSDPNCLVWHGGIKEMSLEEAIERRPQMYAHFLRPLLLGRILVFIPPKRKIYPTSTHEHEANLSGRIAVMVDEKGEVTEVKVNR